MNKIGKNRIYNEDCRETMRRMIDGGDKVDLILTSPPYNTNKKASSKTLLTATACGYPHLRYDTIQDVMTNSEYIEFTKQVFAGFEKILAQNGVILYNMSYGNENTEIMPLTVSSIIQDTDFTLADIVVWKKSSAMPNNVSPNRLTRLVEFIYVFARKSQLKSFKTNKRKVSERANGQAMFENLFNFVEAKNNDGSCKLNKATFSSELVGKLLNIYASRGATVYDPFMGTGTTAVGCLEYGCSFIGSEISKRQCEFAQDRIAGTPRPLLDAFSLEGLCES